MNKKHNRLIATARQYALVTFLGLGMSFAVVNKAVGTQKVVGMTEQEWVLNDPSAPTSPASYSLNDGPPLSDCQGTAVICGIKAINDGTDHPVIDEVLEDEITEGSPTSNVFRRN